MLGMLDGNEVEVKDLITSLHLSDEYLSTEERNVRLDRFWNPRKSLHCPVDAQSNFGEGFVGVLDMIKGISYQILFR
jgi:hypothetical protein